MTLLVMIWSSVWAGDAAPVTMTSTSSAIHDLDDEEADVGPALKPEAVSEAVGKYAWAVSDCYTRNAIKGQKGRLTVEFHVMPDGSVSDAKVQASDLKNSALEGCIVETMKKVRFAASNGPEIVATFPFVF